MKAVICWCDVCSDKEEENAPGRSGSIQTSRMRIVQGSDPDTETTDHNINVETRQNIDKTYTVQCSRATYFKNYV